jgi:hypothetical protein
VASSQPNPQSTLTNLIRAWDRRLRLQQLLRWLAVSLMPGLILGITLAVISRFRPFMLGDQILTYTLIATGVGFVLFLLGVILYPRSTSRAAQKFDILFQLNERVSTALELIGGRIRTNEEFTDRQLNDALKQARAIRPGDYIPLSIRWIDWGLVALMALVLGIMLFLPNPMEAAVVSAEEPNPAIEDAADILRDITEDIAADPNLTDDNRESLLEELETSIETLEQDDITTEEAFAELSDVESELQNQADELGEQLAQQQQGLADARNALEGAFPETGEEADAGEERSDLEELSDQLDEIAEVEPESSESQSMADALREAAEALEQSNPEAADALRDAAEAMENGDTQALQESLDQAQEALGDQGQQQQNLQQSQENLQEGADQAQQGQQNLQQGQQQQGDQQQGQQGQQQQGEQQEGQQGQMQQGESWQGEEGELFVLTTPQADGDQSGATMQQDGEQQGQQSAAQQGQQGQQAGQQSGQQAGQMQGAQAASSSAGGGAGDEDTNGITDGFQASDNPIDTNNNPDGEGVEEFEAIYSPQRLGGEGGPGISLETEDGNSPLVEGDFSENPTGQTTVPYNEVFSDYSDQASQALESDYIPLGMQDIVRDYFTSIEPGQ